MIRTSSSASHSSSGSGGMPQSEMPGIGGGRNSLLILVSSSSSSPPFASPSTSPSTRPSTLVGLRLRGGVDAPPDEPGKRVVDQVCPALLALPPTKGVPLLDTASVISDPPTRSFRCAGLRTIDPETFCCWITREDEATGFCSEDRSISVLI